MFTKHEPRALLFQPHGIRLGVEDAIREPEPSLRVSSGELLV